MQTRKLGYTGLEFSVIGFGAWAIGGGNWQFGWGPQEDKESIAAIQKALDLGINWIDTAAAYGLGRSERVVGEAIKGRRDQVFVATKCSLVWDGPIHGSISNRLKAWSVRKEAEESLKRLGVDVIDLYQVHWPNPDADIEEGWGEIAKLIEEGKVRCAGVSNFSISQMKRCQAIHPIASLQPPYSLLERGVEAELLDFCARNEIGVVAYSPMASGLLTGKFNRARVASLPDDDWRRERGKHFHEPEFGFNLALVEHLSTLARRHNHSVGELAVAWVLRRPELTAAIVGARNPRQIEEIAPASAWQLSKAELDEIDQWLLERQQAMAKG